MDDSDDSESWSAAASLHPELAAHQIARFRNPGWNPPWRDLVPAEPAPPSVSVEWGSRRKRSRSGAGPTRIRNRYPKAFGLVASPATPLDFGSGSGSASASGSEEASSSMEKAQASATLDERKRTADDDVSAGGGCVVSKTMCELQEEEKSLLEHKIILQKELELGRKAYKALQVENKRLKSQQSSLLSERVSAMVASEVSPLPSSSSQFLLPDLNEPLSGNLD
ncbi:uncharacterized protein M6B38_279635 [Iris pallida]|uniref:Uncharacterized protein n=1 Tax=Iris pallida TaxID=29817 RepID=A0AAX6HZ32_IRIPA|nr:uncharacterized protein M6B38_279635 [Iris pallida]